MNNIKLAKTGLVLVYLIGLPLIAAHIALYNGADNYKNGPADVYFGFLTLWLTIGQIGIISSFFLLQMWWEWICDRG